MAIKISAISHYLPTNFRTSLQIEELLGTKNPNLKLTSGIIESITGIKSRPLADNDQYSSTMAIEAAKKLIQTNKIDINQIDLLIYASATQDLIEPATSHIIQNALSTTAHCFDIKNACNSFLNGLEVACSLLNSGNYTCAIVLVGEKPSVSLKDNLVNKADFKNSFAGYTFGDSGAAVLLEIASPDQKGIFFQKSTTNSKFWELGMLPGGGSRHPRGDQYSYFVGSGLALRDAFVSVGSKFIHDCLTEAKADYNDFARVFIHQVSIPFLDEFLDRTGIPKTKVEITVPQYGNLAAATLPLGLSMAIENQTVKKGDQVLLIGLAGGISLSVTMIEI